MILEGSVAVAERAKHNFRWVEKARAGKKERE